MRARYARHGNDLGTLEILELEIGSNFQWYSFHCLKQIKIIQQTEGGMCVVDKAEDIAE